MRAGLASSAEILLDKLSIPSRDMRILLDLSN
jgi:hypothetical protein